MSLLKKNYDPATMAGAVDAITADLQDILDTTGNELVEFDETASAVNNLRIANAIANAGPTLSAQGDDTNIDLNLSSKGTGTVGIWTGNSGRLGLRLIDTASSVNHVTVTPAITLGSPALTATGTDTSISLQLTPTGTGLILLGSSSTGTVSGGAVTINAQRGVITTGAVPSAATNTYYPIDFANNKITSNSVLQLTLAGSNVTAGLPILGAATLGNGSATIRIGNATSTVTITGSVGIHFLVL